MFFGFRGRTVSLFDRMAEFPVRNILAKMIVKKTYATSKAAVVTILPCCGRVQIAINAGNERGESPLRPADFAEGE